MNPILTMSVLDLAKNIREGTYTAREVLDAHIQRIETVNPVLNAVVADRFDTARREADAIDELLRSGYDNPPPLLGVPCTMKEFIAVKGQPHTGGLHVRKEVTATENAVLVQRLKDAGAIIMGSTNAPEGGLWMETVNTVYGRTNNPWNLRHTSGGSSGGEGAIISTGGSPFGIGSDVGGSIRIPAAFCGIVGHKPTGAMVPHHGHQPPGHVGPYLVVGPMTRHVRDIWPILSVIRGPSPKDTHVTPFPHHHPEHVDVSKLRVLFMDNPPLVSPRAEVRETLSLAAETLRRRGATVAPLKLTNLKYAMEMWSSILQEAQPHGYDVILGDGTPIAAGWELLKWPFVNSKYTLPALLVAWGERYAAMFKKRSARMIRLGHALSEELNTVLGEDGVLLYPPYTRAAPRHHRALLTPLDPVCTAVFNITKNPVTQVPLGMSSNGLPLGVQVVGGIGQDHLCVAAAEVIEAEHGGWIPSMTDR